MALQHYVQQQELIRQHPLHLLWKRIHLLPRYLSALPTRNLEDHLIAAMLYTVILSPDIKISSLSSATLQYIFQGHATNWSEVGGPEYDKNIKLKKGWAQAVAHTPGAISYVSLADAQAANVSIVGINGILPGVQALQQGSYPFWSVEHLYTQGDGSVQLRAYLPFLVSEQEVPAFRRMGVVPISMLSQDVLASHLPGPEI